MVEGQRKEYTTGEKGWLNIIADLEAISHILRFLFSLINLILLVNICMYKIPVSNRLARYMKALTKLLQASYSLNHIKYSRQSLNGSPGLGIYKAEEEDAFLYNQYVALDCKTNGLLTRASDAVQSVWHTGQFAYGETTSYIKDSWARLMLPFTQINAYLGSKVSGTSSFIVTLLEGLWEGLRNLLMVPLDTFSYMWGFFTGVMSFVVNALGHTWGLFRSPFSTTVKYDDTMQCATKEDHSKEQRSADLSLNYVKNFEASILALQRKIEGLENKIQLERQSRQSGNEVYLQKIKEEYQTMVENIKQPSEPSISIEHFENMLNGHSEILKKWIYENFLLKANATNIDEHRLALLVKHTKTIEEKLLAFEREFGQFVITHKNEIESLKNSENTYETSLSSDVSIPYVKKLISDAINLYDADKTGKVDYALEAAGGQIQSIRCTETYIASPKSYILLGWTIYSKTSSPRDAINPGMTPGQCWAFVGSQGYLVIRLSHTIKVSGFTLEHISKSLVPKGHIESAPKNFSMWGLESEHDPEPHLFGEYVYLDNDETLQYFPVVHQTSNTYNMVELKIHTNHGNPNYTCLYRIRVHGEPESL